MAETPAVLVQKESSSKISVSEADMKGYRNRMVGAFKKFGFGRVFIMPTSSKAKIEDCSGAVPGVVMGVPLATVVSGISSVTPDVSVVGKRIDGPANSAMPVTVLGTTVNGAAGSTVQVVN
jgi:hypothetical protein